MAPLKGPDGHVILAQSRRSNESDQQRQCRWLEVAVTQQGSTKTMDKKAKKKLEITRKNLQVLRLALAGARKQDDEPGEINRLEQEIAKLEADAEKLKSS